MDSIAAEAALCPNCGSRNVRWRNTRPYDYIFTWTRFLLDTLFSALLIRPAGPGVATGYRSEWVLRTESRALEYRRRRAAYEAKVGLAVAKRFWRCPDCRRRGQVSSGLDEELTTDRASLASLEDQVVSEGGAVGSRVDRDGLSND